MKDYDCLVLILGGGRGTRLFPLTLERSKPAIGFAGKYRLIDVPLSNCINSQMNKIFVLTQYLAPSLRRHIFQTYRFDIFSQGFIEILTAEQTQTDFEWYQGTADAVRRSLRHIRSLPFEHALILSGDHLYKMDYREILGFHAEKSADITIASIPIEKKDISRMGILDCQANGRVSALFEKPDKIEDIERFAIKMPGQSPRKSYLASMGVYVFKKDVLIKVLEEIDQADFGRQILPWAIPKFKVFSYLFDGYWVDIGTIKSYFDASINLTSEKPRFRLFDERWPLFSRPRFLPPTKIIKSTVQNSIISDGGQIYDAQISNSVIGVRSIIKKQASIRESVIMGNDYYEAKLEGRISLPYIGRSVAIRRAIVDKNVTIGDFSKIGYKRYHKNVDHKLYYVRDGIVIIPRSAVIPPKSDF